MRSGLNFEPELVCRPTSLSGRFLLLLVVAVAGSMVTKWVVEDAQSLCVGC